MGAGYSSPSDILVAYKIYNKSNLPIESINIKFTVVRNVYESGSEEMGPIDTESVVFESFTEESGVLFNSNFTNLKTKEDYLLWLTLSKKNIRLDHFKKVLSAWRLSPNSLSSDVLQKLKDAFNIYFLYEKQNFFKSCISVCILSFNALKKNFRMFF